VSGDDWAIIVGEIGILLEEAGGEESVSNGDRRVMGV
jgi:hypothetical protein